MRAGRGPAARAELEPAKRSGAAAVGIIRRFGISCVMALRGGFARLFRRRADAGLRLSRRAHSVALVGAPFSRGQVGAGPGRAGGPQPGDGRRSLTRPFFFVSQKRRGVDHGPATLRAAGLVERLAGLGEAPRAAIRLVPPPSGPARPRRGSPFPAPIGGA